MTSFVSDTMATVFSSIVSLGLLIPSLAIAVRRLHDTGRGGGWLFIGLIPLVGAIVLIIFFCQDSEMYANRFGDVPNISY